jgi:hypothetical protein
MLLPTVQSASLSGNKQPIWGLRQDLYYCQTAAGDCPSLIIVWHGPHTENTGLILLHGTDHIENTDSSIVV